MSAFEDMEKSAKDGADIARRTRKGETEDAQLLRMLKETGAHGYRTAVQQLRMLGMVMQATCLDVTGEEIFGEDYRTMPVEGEPKR